MFTVGKCFVLIYIKQKFFNVKTKSAYDAVTFSNLKEFKMIEKTLSALRL